MGLQETIQYVNKKFVYTKNKPYKLLANNCYIMSEKDGKYYGNCEDYSITIMYLIAGGYLKMFWKLLTGEFNLHYVLTDNNINGHVIGQINDIWFDNLTFCGNTKEEHFKRTQQIYNRKLDPVEVISDILYVKFLGV